MSPSLTWPVNCLLNIVISFEFEDSLQIVFLRRNKIENFWRTKFLLLKKHSDWFFQKKSLSSLQKHFCVLCWQGCKKWHSKRRTTMFKKIKIGLSSKKNPCWGSSLIEIIRFDAHNPLARESDKLTNGLQFSSAYVELKCGNVQKSDHEKNSWVKI